MAARHKQNQASNSYNLRNRVEIPIELQVENDSTFFNEFSSQPSAGQVLSSTESSDTDTSSTDLGFLEDIEGSDHSDSQKKVKKLKVKSSENVIRSGQGSDMSHQTFINDRILSQLDAINKRLDAIESSGSASVSKLHAAPWGKKRSVKTADSNLKPSDYSAKNLDEKMPDLKYIRQDRFIQQQIKEQIRQLSGLANKGTDTKIMLLKGDVDVYVKQRVKCRH